MPKLKTHSGAKKRFKVTKSGKVKRGQAKRRHLLSHKAARQMRALRTPAYVHEADVAEMKRLLPYG
ncbi:MAG: 50S ribosomal protein L35 [Deltaproteobacteria bacterium]|nr:50S ribosomal protein L35 [Deltaproteobacteria bacterium]